MTPYRCYHCRQEVEAGAVDAESVSRCPGCGVPLAIPPQLAAAYCEPTIDMPVRTRLAQLDSTPVKLTVLAILLGLTLYAAVFGNAVTIAFCLFILFGTINGYWVGASTMTAAFVGTLAAAAVALPLGRHIEPLMRSMLGTTGMTNRLVAVAAVAATVMAFVAVICRLVLNRVMHKRQTWRVHNRVFGAGLGLVEGVALTVALIWAVISLEPVRAVPAPQWALSQPVETVANNATVASAPATNTTNPSVDPGGAGADVARDAAAASPSAPADTVSSLPSAETPVAKPPVTTPPKSQTTRTEQAVGAIAAAARESTVGRVAQQVNPLDQLRLFVLSQKTLIVLNDPDARESFLQYPVIKRIQQYPSVQEALTILRDDPLITKVLESPNGVRPDDVLAVLDSPVLLEAIDSTDVLADLAPDAAAIEKALEYASAARVPTKTEPHIDAADDDDSDADSPPDTAPAPQPSPTPQHIAPGSAPALTLDGE